jgi:anti-sigma B factor antagonist
MPYRAARSELQEVIKIGQGKLVLNLAEVSFMDSTGLSVLISALKATRTKEGNVALLNLTPPVYSLIEITLLQQVFSIFEDEAAAIVSVK